MLINAKVGVKNENVPPFYRSEIFGLSESIFVEIMTTSGALGYII